jgi:hypothetical protein
VRPLPKPVENVYCTAYLPPAPENSPRQQRKIYKDFKKAIAFYKFRDRIKMHSGTEWI